MSDVRTTPLVVTVLDRPHAPPGAWSAWIRMVGDVVLGSEPALAGVVEHLSRSRPDVVVIDVTAVTFVCSTFANFVADVHAAVPDASLILHNPSPMARLVLAVTGLDTILTMPDVERSM